MKKYEEIAYRRQLEAGRRKRLVMELMLAGAGRRLTTRQIAQALYEGGTDRYGKPDPNTTSRNERDEAWSHQTIAADIKEVESAWVADSVSSLAGHKAKFLARYEALWERAWRAGQFEECRKVLDAERKMLGTDAPQVIVFEQMQAQMLTVINRVKQRFGDRPELLKEFFAAMSGDFETGEQSNTGTPANRGVLN